MLFADSPYLRIYDSFKYHFIILNFLYLFEQFIRFFINFLLFLIKCIYVWKQSRAWLVKMFS